MVAVSQTFGVLLLLTSVFAQADAMKMYEPGLCFILDGFLGLYGLFITGLLIKEKFFKSKTMSVEEGLYHDPRGQSDGGYDQLRQQERGRNRLANNDETYTGLTRRTEGEYKELPIKRERQRKKETVYQDLKSASRDTYDILHMQPPSGR